MIYSLFLFIRIKSPRACVKSSPEHDTKANRTPIQRVDASSSSHESIESYWDSETHSILESYSKHSELLHAILPLRILKLCLILLLLVFVVEW